MSANEVHGSAQAQLMRRSRAAHPCRPYRGLGFMQRLKQAIPRFTLSDAQSILLSGQQQRVFHQCRTAASVLAMLNRLWFARNQTSVFGGTSSPPPPKKKNRAAASRARSPRPAQ